MLPDSSRLRRRADFDQVVRRGRRTGRRTLVLHLLPDDPACPDRSRIGFVVGRRVGNAVCRNRVSRQLRHLVRDRLDSLPAGIRVVVRAQPAAAGRTSAELAEDLDAGLDRLLGRNRPHSAGAT
jgi:ribonuclease P protein component